MIKLVLKCTVILGLSLIGLLYGLDLQYRLKPVPEVLFSKKKNTLSISGLIRDDNLLLKAMVLDSTDMNALSGQLLSMIKSGEKEIFIKINSQGGLLHAGNAFLFLMRDAQSFGVKFTCVIDGQAMSMAVIIFTECDTRLAIIGSNIMWHSIAQMNTDRINVFKAEALAQELDKLNSLYWFNTRIHFYPGYFAYHFKKETILSVTDVQNHSFMYLTIIREHVIQ